MLMMVLTLSITFYSCSSITIGVAIQQLKEKCPQDYGNGITMTDADIVNGDAIITLQAPNGTTDAVEAFKNNIIATVKSDAELAKVLKDSDTKLIYRFVCSDGQKDVVVLPSEL